MKLQEALDSAVQKAAQRAAERQAARLARSESRWKANLQPLFPEPEQTKVIVSANLGKPIFVSKLERKRARDLRWQANRAAKAEANRQMAKGMGAGKKNKG